MEKLVGASEKYFLENIPSSRSKDGYLIHVGLVRKYALILAEVYGADKLVCEVAAILHDTGADAGRIHNHKSAEIADEFLKNLGAEDVLRSRIVSAIKNHSGPGSSAGYVEDVPLEDQIIRDADSISFLEESLPDYLNIGLEESGGDRNKTREDGLKKIDSMMKKVKTEKGLELARERYGSAKEFILKF